MNTLKKINRKDIEDIIALTSTQEGMLYHYLKDPDSDSYFEQLSLRITGKIDFNCFKKAWDFVVETNEMLRTSFRWDMVKKPVQIILKKHRVQAVFHDFSSRGMDENYRLKLIEEIKNKDRKNRFDLNSVPFRVTLCKIDEYKYEMIISNHHILYDGWSNRIILKEFFSVYIDLVQQKSPVKPHKHKYKEYISWIQEQDVQKQREYWTRYLKGFDTKSELSIKRKKGKNISTVATGNSHYEINFSKAEREKIEIFTKSHKITLACLLYSAWGILLQGYNNCEDVIFGTTVSGRPSEVKGIEDIVGLFINTVPLRVRTNGNGHEKIQDFLYRMNKQLREREAYESASLVEIKECGEGVFEDELFDTIFVIENYPLDKVLSERNNPLSLSVDSYSIFETTHYDLTVGVTLMNDIEIEFTYNQNLFEESIIKELPRHFMKIVETIIDNPGKEVLELELLSEAEKNKILYDFNKTGANYPKDKTIHGLFTEQAGKIPDNIAVIGGESGEGRRFIASLTYKELSKKSQQLACLLRAEGLEPGDIAGIIAERSLDMLIGIIGILKAGGAYLPMDTEYPQERIRYMLADSNANILVTTPDLSEKFEKLLMLNCQLLMINEKTLYRRRLNNPPKEANSINNYQLTIYNLQLEQAILAYVIYTSGTTGKPKGVMVEHFAVMNRLFWVRDKYRLNERDVILQATSFVFDVSVCEMFRWIPPGGKLCLLPAGGEKDPGQIVRTIARNGVTTADFIPAMLTLLLDYADRQNLLKELASLRWVWTGVEVVGLNLVKGFNETLHRLNRTRLINAYGPTESTVDVTYFDCSHIEACDVVPIGRPMANVRIYILASNGAVQPVGVYGELCIAGKGLARGYLNNPELTAEKFCLRRPGGALFEGKRGLAPLSLRIPGKGPMQSCNHASMQYHSLPPHSPLYLTGDLARWLPDGDGDIQFQGRMDHQVKIRGYRVELGEIESRLLRHEKIKDAVVILGGGNEKEKYLCAYIISEERIDVPSLGDELSLELPDYMVPSYIKQLDKIPLTTSGKVDRRALPEPGLGVIGVEYTAPVDRWEEKLVSIWSDVLNLEKNEIGTGYNFFKLGGHSLKAVRLISGIQKELNVEVPLEEIFKLPTIRELAGYIRGLTKEKTGEQYIPVESVEEKEYYALSSVQRRLYFLQEIDKNATAYNMPSVWLMEGIVDKKRLEDTLEKLIQRHESLRTSFKVIDDEPVQVVHNETVIGHWRLVIGEAEESQKDNIIKNFVKPFVLSRAPLLRVALQKIGEQTHLLLVDMHHIISDGVAVEVFIKEFIGLQAGQKLPPVKLRYKDYSEWQRSKKQKEKIKRQESYWLKQFEGEIPILNLPYDFPRPLVQSFAGSMLRFEISREETRGLISVAHEQGATLYMILFSIYTVFLSKLSGKEDIFVGTPVAGRRHADLQSIIGMFVNTLVMRNFTDGAKSFTQFVKELKERTLNAFENQDYPFEELVEQLEVERDASRNPMFETMFALQNMDTATIEIPGLKLAPFQYETRTAKFDLTLTAVEAGERLSFIFEYSTRLFKEETIERFVHYFTNILTAVIADKMTKLAEIDIIPGEEKRQILYDFNNTAAAYPKYKRIHQLFTEQVERTPGGAALIGRGCGDRRINENITLTYRELNHRANRLAHNLRQRGASRGQVLGLMVDRSVEMVIGLYGILKLGGAYMPVAPDYPAERIRYMLEDSSSQWLVTQKKHIVSTNFGGNTIDIETESLYPARFRFDPMEKENNNPGNLIYVIYTSGSTGKPKGVPIKAGGFVNLVWWYVNELKVEAVDKFLVISPISFDLTQKNLFAPLITGGSLHLAPPGFMDYEAVSGFIARERQTVINCAPSAFYPFMEFNRDDGFERIKTLRYVILGGEPIQLGKLLPWSSSGGCGCEIYNTYGPTECTDVVSFYPLEKDKLGQDSVIPIGKPVNNTILLVLDRMQKLQPPGVLGEICIAGIGTGPGYCNNAEFTAEKFILIRAPRRHLPAGRIYRTGDLGRWLPGGNIEFLGRSDHQVKIRGLRIELEEIESVLLMHPGIKEAVVEVKENDKNEKYVCAYIVSAGKVAAPALRDFLSTSLPAYMIPSHFVMLDHIPLTPSGKINRKALPAPEIDIGDNYAAPRDEIEKRLAVIWSEVLGVGEEKISINDNFFHLGGHSLKATIVLAKIHREFCKKMTLTEIFRKPVLEDLAESIREAVKDKYISIEPAEKKDYYELSSAQKRFYVLQKMDLTNTSFNFSIIMILEGEPDKKKFEETFRKLLKRNESLRTSFEEIEGKPVQIIHDRVAPNIEYSSLEFEVEEPGMTQSITRLIANFIRPFDLDHAPLIRVGLIKEENKKHILMIDVHHIIVDGLALEIFCSEFFKFYRGEELPHLRLRYKDFSALQNSEKEKTRMKAQEDYWLKIFGGNIPVLNLSTDYARLEVQSFEGDFVKFEIGSEETNFLKNLAEEEKTTLYILFLAICNIWLSKICNQEAIVIGTGAACRRHPDIQHMIGCFQNMLALINYPEVEKTFMEFLKEVKERAMEAFENQEYPFEELVKKIALKREQGRNPLFDVFYLLQKAEVELTGIFEAEIHELKVQPYYHQNRTTRFDLGLYGIDRGGSLYFNIEYCTRLFKVDTIKELIRYFKDIIHAIKDNKNLKLKDIKISHNLFTTKDIFTSEDYMDFNF